MELRNLKTFVKLSEIKNFTKTAQFLGYAQSSITAQIKQLEDELNVQLFERIGKKISLTNEGQQLLPYAKRMLDLSEDINELYSKKKGRLTIGVSESIGIYRLPALIRRYKRRFPDIDLNIVLVDTDDFIPLLKNNTMDMALILNPPITDPSIRVELDLSEAIGIFTAPDYPLASYEDFTLQDLANESILLTGSTCCYRQLFEQLLKHHGVEMKTVLETSSIQLIKETALSGLGLCILPDLTVIKELEQGSLIKLPISLDFNLSSQLIYHKDKCVTPAMNNFIDIIKAYS